MSCHCICVLTDGSHGLTTRRTVAQGLIAKGNQILSAAQDGLHLYCRSARCAWSILVPSSQEQVFWFARWWTTHQKVFPLEVSWTNSWRRRDEFARLTNRLPAINPVLQNEPRLARLRPVAAWGVGCLCLSAQTGGEVIRRVDRSQRDEKMLGVCCDDSEGRWCPMECGARETDPRFSENPLSRPDRAISSVPRGVQQPRTWQAQLHRVCRANFMFLSRACFFI